MGALGCAAYWLGYKAGLYQADFLAQQYQAQLRALKERQNRISEWVKKTWPTEYDANHSGYVEGYRSGIAHGAEYANEQEDDAS